MPGSVHRPSGGDSGLACPPGGRTRKNAVRPLGGLSIQKAPAGRTQVDAGPSSLSRSPGGRPRRKQSALRAGCPSKGACSGRSLTQSMDGPGELRPVAIGHTFRARESVVRRHSCAIRVRASNLRSISCAILVHLSPTIAHEIEGADAERAISPCAGQRVCPAGSARLFLATDERRSPTHSDVPPRPASHSSAPPASWAEAATLTWTTTTVRPPGGLPVFIDRPPGGLCLLDRPPGCPSFIDRPSGRAARLPSTALRAACVFSTALRAAGVFRTALQAACPSSSTALRAAGVFRTALQAACPSSSTALRAGFPTWTALPGGLCLIGCTP